ncbi:hypothetical protein ACFYVL_09075 [Streptomyces sp. NPDC004111]|uniref:hypothetical protein n=1 Tax=Streptomyces sp. NPDC004111 TaxID=3364690 RepID=UPI003690E125
MWSARRWRRKTSHLERLDLPNVTCVRDLVDEVSRRIGRKVELVPVERAPGAAPLACGKAEIGATFVTIEYDARTSVLHQDHIIAHELCHLLLGHHESLSPADLSENLLDGCVGGDAVQMMLLGRTVHDEGEVQMVLRRTVYDADEERDTEHLASLLQSRIIAHVTRTDESSGDEVQDRVSRTLLRRRETRG